MRRIEPPRKRSFKVRVLHLFSKESGFESPMHHEEETHTGIPATYRHFNSHREIKNALLEAEQDRATATMEWQRRRFLWR